MNEKKCIHTYLTRCKTNPQPPGFADYLRGTIALYNLSKNYGYKLLINGNHPLFKFIKPNENIISSEEESCSEILELLPPLSYNDIYRELNNIFNSGKSFSVMTNSFYNLNMNHLSNWGKISIECRFFLKNIFTPSTEIETKMAYIFDTIYNIKHDEKFKVIHLRLGDNFIHNDVYDYNLHEMYYTKINRIINNNTEDIKYVLISDSAFVAKKIKANLNKICYWDNQKIHIGDLINNTGSSLMDTLTDFFIMSKATEIISNGSSGFSTSVSIMYDINHTIL
jgi:hypothetical protein